MLYNWLHEENFATKFIAATFLHSIPIIYALQKEFKPKRVQTQECINSRIRKHYGIVK
ncbi:hypothetical protein RUMOBE_01268 [Blautia obeum ATCC 29174]|uniref:Uncharacterized protein n=1 Tax=Blautia obeum ATCC 29174 TaxID=411459 RepID=A5ZQJ8_9FIRM|nr:hypothetical protein RUMOBE_01268 [Blautia obeum ATCC 29174]